MKLIKFGQNIFIENNRGEILESISLVSNWRNPRQIVHYLQHTPLLQFRLMAGLTFTYFVQASIFILSLEKITFAPLMSLDGIKLIFWFLLSVGFTSFVVIYASTFVIWVCAKCFNGKGTLPQTRAAIIWTLVSLIPVGFLLLLIYFTFTHPHLGRLSFVMRMACYLGILATLIYGFIVMIKTVSETHRLGLWNSFFAAMMGVAMFSLLLYAAKPYLF